MNLVNKFAFSNGTIHVVFRALQLQDGSTQCLWTEILKLFLNFLHWFFVHFWTMWGYPVIVNKISLFHGRKSRGHQTSKIIKSRQSYSNGHLPYHCSFYYLACTLMHDVACEFVCAVRMQLLVAWLSLSIPVNVKLTSDNFLKWNQCLCGHTLLNQHWTVLKLN